MMPQSNLPRQNRAVRIGPLAVLPIFLDLHGRHAMVIGASEGALWKAELLLQAGASVTLVVDEASAAVLQWSTDISADGLTLVTGPWRNFPFDGVAIVVADLDDDQAIELATKAQRAGALVNIVDKPAHCQFQFGAIVNKSPLVIGISTGGAAPVLAQMVRSLIEAALPQNLQSLAQRASCLRTRVNERLRDAAARRRYWNAFFGRALTGRASQEEQGPLRHCIRATVPGELTLRDLEMLRRADRVILKSGASAEIAALCRREAVRSLSSRGDRPVAHDGVTVTIAPPAEIVSFKNSESLSQLLDAIRKRFPIADLVLRKDDRAAWLYLIVVTLYFSTCYFVQIDPKAPWPAAGITVISLFSFLKM